MARKDENDFYEERAEIKEEIQELEVGVKEDMIILERKILDHLSSLREKIATIEVKLDLAINRPCKNWEYMKTNRIFIYVISAMVLGIISYLTGIQLKI